MGNFGVSINWQLYISLFGINIAGNGQFLYENVEVHWPFAMLQISLFTYVSDLLHWKF